MTVSADTHNVGQLDRSMTSTETMMKMHLRRDPTTTGQPELANETVETQTLCSQPPPGQRIAP